MMKYLLLLLLVINIIMPLPVTAPDPFKLPVVEELDLLLDGSINHQSVFPNNTYAFITSIIFDLEWTSNTVDLDEFGASPPLTNGTVIRYDEINGSNLIQRNRDFAEITYDMTIYSDDKNPKNNHLVARFSFMNMLPPNGLEISDDHVLSFLIRDNMTALVDEFIVIIRGFAGGEVITSTTATPMFAEIAANSGAGIFSNMPGLFLASVGLAILTSSFIFKRLSG